MLWRMDSVLEVETCIKIREGCIWDGFLATGLPIDASFAGIGGGWRVRCRAAYGALQHKRSHWRAYRHEQIIQG